MEAKLSWQIYGEAESSGETTNNVIFWLFCISRLVGIQPQTKLPAKVNDVMSENPVRFFNMFVPEDLTHHPAKLAALLQLISIFIHVDTSALPAQWRGTSWTTQQHPSLRRWRLKS